MEFVTVCTIGVVLITLYFLLWKKRPKNFPPGPPAYIPLFGNVIEMGDLAHIRLLKLEQQYGPIIGLMFGSYPTVILNNPDDIREAFGRPEFSGRYGYNPFLEENVSDATKGVVMSFGRTWTTSRRLSLKGLRDHGFGKRSMESIILEEVEELLEELKKKLNVPISTRGMFNPSVLNVIWSIVAGKRYNLDDERLEELLRYIYELMKNSFSGRKILNFMFPTATILNSFISRYFPQDENKVRQDKLKSFLHSTVQEHRKTIQIGNPRDFIDSYLEEKMKTGEDKPDDEGNDLDLVFTLLDLFAAGSETTSTTLNWAFFFLALHPLAQEKLYQELQTVIGSRTVRLEDRSNLPYAEATMAEIYRVSSLAALSIAHSTTQDVTFRGYTFKKDTTVYGNFYAVHFSQAIWGDPQNFRPERFLSDDEKTFNRHPNLIPFSVGRRVCLGETLARDEFFLFLMNLVQQLKITMPHDEPKHSMEGQDGLVLTPEQHRIYLIDRNT